MNTTAHAYPRPDETFGVMLNATDSHPFDGSNPDWAAFKRVCNQRDKALNALAGLLEQADAQFRAGDRHATFNKQTIDAASVALRAAISP